MQVQTCVCVLMCTCVNSNVYLSVFTRLIWAIVVYIRFGDLCMLHSVSVNSNMHLCTWKNPCSPHRSWRWSGSRWLYRRRHRRSAACSCRTHQKPEWTYSQPWTPSLNKEITDKKQNTWNQCLVINNFHLHKNSATNQQKKKRKGKKDESSCQLPTSNIWSKFKMIILKLWLHKLCDNKSVTVPTFCFFSWYCCENSCETHHVFPPVSIPAIQCPLPQDKSQSPVFFGGKLNSSVSVLGRGTGAIWIKWKNPCSTPKCWIWVTFDYIVLRVSISLNGLVRKGGEEACHRKASILINKQSLSYSQSSFLIPFFAFTAEWKRSKWWKEMKGRGWRR